MDEQLREALEKWQRQIEVLRKAEETYLNLDASEKPMFAELFLSKEGKNVSERECMAYADPRWVEFKNGLVIAHSEFNKQKRNLEVFQKVFDAVYLTYKITNDFIKKGYI